MRPETIKLLKANRGKVLDIGLGSDILAMTPKAQTKKAKINKWDHIKVKTAQQRRPSVKWNSQQWMGESIHRPHI